MRREREDDDGVFDITKLVVWFAIGFFSIIILSMAGCPYYNVWEQEMRGKAELSRAEQNRKIRIQEASAKLESAKLTAQAEVEEARGAAEANKIMADSLGGADEYLRWKYINMLSERKDGDRTVVYVPTEAQIPVMEANRLQQQPQKK